MWVARIRINGSDALLGSRALRFNIALSGYPVSSFISDDWIHVYLVGFVFGADIDKKAFLRDLKRDDRVVHLETNNDFIILQIKEPLSLKPMYHHRIVHLKPVIISSNGSELWTIGSWDRNDLNDFVKLVDEFYDGELLVIKKEHIKSFSIISFQPELTNKQRSALELAIREGYYDYPRRVTLEDLALMMNVSYSTFQAHLRKAEKKLLPFFFKGL